MLRVRPEQVPLRTEEAGPALWRLDDLRDRLVHRKDELLAETAPTFLVESRTKPEVEDRLLVDAVGLLRFRHGARRGSRPWLRPSRGVQPYRANLLRSPLDFARPCLLDFLCSEAAVESGLQLVHERLALLIRELQGRFEDLFHCFGHFQFTPARS